MADARNYFAIREGFDSKPAFWDYALMKTTLDLPDDVMHAVKIRAVHERRRLKDLIAELLRRGLQSPPGAPEARTTKLPVSSARGGLQRGVKLNDSPALLKRMER